MPNLDEMWAARTGLREVPPDVRAEWERRVAPLLDSPSGKWQARMEADEIIDQWLMVMIYRHVRASGNTDKVLEAVKAGREAVLEAIRAGLSGRESDGPGFEAVKAELAEIRKAIGRTPDPGLETVKAELAEIRKEIGRESGGQELSAVKEALEKNGASLNAIRKALATGMDTSALQARLDEIAARLENNSRDGEILKAVWELSARLEEPAVRPGWREKWRAWAIAGFCGIVLLTGAFFAGWQSRETFFEHVWVELPGSHEADEGNRKWPPKHFNPKATWE